jgi:hypothetical protein
MTRYLSRRLLGIVLLPLLLVLGGVGPGNWHCADGVPCDSASALVCCCGCEASEAAPALDCDDAGGVQHVANESCGCYYAASVVDAQHKVGPNVELAAALATPKPLFAAPVSSQVSGFDPVDSGCPPRFLVSPRNGRAPPLA